MKTDGTLKVATSLPGYWGKGHTLEEALAKAKYIKGTEHYKVFLVHPDTVMDDMGGFRYPEGFPPKEILTGRVVKAKAQKV
jgi:hypothetical protein